MLALSDHSQGMGQRIIPWNLGFKPHPRFWTKGGVKNDPRLKNLREAATDPVSQILNRHHCTVNVF